MIAPAEIDEHPLMGPGRGRLEGKVAIVTGADNGIGRATARLFAREGARVVCMDVRESGKLRIDRLIAEEKGEAAFVQGDVSNRDDWDRVVKTAVGQFGGLDILHGNAGGGSAGKIHEISESEWGRVIHLNMYGLFYGARAVIPHLLEAGQGSIVFTASTHGIMGRAGSAAYCATNAAIVNLTREMAIDYGPGIRVNCVCPGPIATSRFATTSEDHKADQIAAVRALHRMGQPEEVAYAVLFLASDESSYITGHPLVIDGGQTIDVR